MPVDNIAQFNADVAKFAEKLLPQQVVALQKKLVIDIVTGAILLTPVDTGRARGGWQVTEGAPTDRDSGRVDKTGAATIAAATIAAARLKPFGIAFVQNNVAYVPFLEDGTDRQPPVGMLRRTIQRIGSAFREAAE